MLLNLRFEYTSIMASWFIYNQFRSVVLFMSRSKSAIQNCCCFYLQIKPRFLDIQLMTTKSQT